MLNLLSCSCMAVELVCSLVFMPFGTSFALDTRTCSDQACRYKKDGRARTWDRARVVESILAEETLTAGLIESNQACDHRLRWSGFRVRDGLLERDAGRLGMKRDVRQPEPLNALPITDGEIDAFGCA